MTSDAGRKEDQKDQIHRELLMVFTFFQSKLEEDHRLEDALVGRTCVRRRRAGVQSMTGRRVIMMSYSDGVNCV